MSTESDICAPLLGLLAALAAAALLLVALEGLSR